MTQENTGMGYTDIVQHHIHMKPNFESCHQRPYRLSPEKRGVLRDHLEKLLDQGIICTVSPDEDVPITSPVVLISKKVKPSKTQGSKEANLSMYRFCVDYRFLNSQTQDFKYTIPNLQELTESFTTQVLNFITSIDLSACFCQMSIAPNCSKYTAFNTCFGTYKFNRLPMGLKTSPNSFQLLMDTILHGLTFKSALCYLDAILICSETFEQHVIDLSEVLNRLSQAGLKLGPRKCKFAQQKCVFLGYQISKTGLCAPTDRVDAITNYPRQTNVKSLRRFLGMIGWFRKFINNFAGVADVLFGLLKKNVKFKWTDIHTCAFDTLKTLLKQSPALAFPRFDIPFRLAVDTSSRGLGYILFQVHPETKDSDGSPKVVRFGSKRLGKWQRHYGPTKLELLGMTTAIIDCASYLRGR